MTAVNDISEQRLRSLAELQADGDRVLSLFLDLDPSQFPTPEARSSEITSLLDEAHRQIEDRERAHDELEQLRAGLERIRRHLRQEASFDGARALAVFCSPSLELFESLRLPSPVARQVAIGRRPFDRLLVAATTELFARFEPLLHADLRARLGPRLSIDVSKATPADVERAVAPVIEAEEREHEDRQLARLHEGLASGGRAVGGLADVLDALEQQRVEVLLCEPGAVREQTIEEAVQAAISQSAEVLVVRDRPDLGPHEGIAAILRF